jgi:hypothetical protein
MSISNAINEWHCCDRAIFLWLMRVDLASLSKQAEDRLLTDPTPPDRRPSASLVQRSYHTLRNLTARSYSASTTKSLDAKTKQQGLSNMSLDCER